MIDSDADMGEQRQQLTTIIVAIALPFFTVAAAVLCYTYIDQLFLSTYPQNWLPYFFFGKTGAIFIFTLALSRLLSKGSVVFNISLLIIFSASVILVRLLLTQEIPAFPFISCLWLVVISSLLGVLTWNSIGDAFDTRQFKRLVKWISGAGSVGGLLVGLLVPIITSHFDVEALLYLLAGLILVSAACLLRLRPIPVAQKKLKRGASPMRYPLFKILIIVMVCLFLVDTLADYILKTEVQATYSKGEIAGFMGPFYGISSVLTLICQVGGVGLVLRYFGLTLLLVILPAYGVLSGAGMVIYPGLWVAAAFRMGVAVFHFSFDNIGREIAINPLPNQVRKAGKLILKGTVKPLGAGAAALILWLLGDLIGLRGIAGVAIAVCFVWIIAARMISQRYKGALEEAVRTRRFGAASDDLSEEALISTRNIAQSALKQKDPESIQFGFTLLEDFKTGGLPEVALSHVDSEHAGVRAAMAKAAGRLEDKGALPLLIERLKVEKDPEVLWRLLEAIAAIKPDSVVDEAVDLLSHESPSIRAGAILILIAAGDLDALIEAGTALKDMIRSSDPEMRKGAARTISALKAGKLEKELHALLADTDEDVCISAIRAVGNRHAVALADELVSKLGRGRPSHYAGRALVELGNVASNLTKNIEDKKGAPLRASIRTLAFVKGPDAETAMAEIAKIGDVAVQSILSKEAAFRARRAPVSESFKESAVKFVSDEAHMIRVLKSAGKTGAISDYLSSEIAASCRFAERRLLYWFAVATSAADIIDTIPVMQPFSGVVAPTSQRAAAIELFDTLAENRELKSAITVFEDWGGMSPEETFTELRKINDPWLTRILDEEYSEYKGGGKMDVTQKVMLLRKVKLFSNLPGEILLTIAEEIEEREMTKEESIFTEGDAPDGLYIVASGQVDIVREEKVLAELKEGHYFGEIALLDENPRTATAQAKTDGMLLYMEKEVFDAITEDVPEVLRSVVQMIISYLRQKYSEN